jgi:putative oxidoreductase
MTVASQLSRFAFGRVSAAPEVQVNLRGGTLLAGRILLSLIFVVSGFAKLTAWDQSIAHMESNGIVQATSLFLVLAVMIELVGGLSVMTGALTRVGALVLFAYLIPVTLMFHGFWKYEGAEHTMQMINFMKNLGLMGGLLALVACGPGQYSIDREIIESRERRRLP